MSDPYENLANAIILQAVKDYRAAGKKLKRNPKNKDAKLMVEDCERHVVEVEAGSQKMAEQMVDDRWKDGEYILDAGNFAGVEFKAICTVD